MKEDYPATLLALEQRFASETACREYLARLRWPRGFLCPACGAANAGPMQRGLWHCRCCQRQTSVLAGTVFQDSHLSLMIWFRAMWHMTSQKNGISALDAEKARLVSASQAQSVVELELGQGKYREVRRLFESQRVTVKRLQRVQIGKIKLGELRAGKWRTLTEPEIKSLMC